MSLIFDLILSKFSKTFLELITYFFCLQRVAFAGDLSDWDFMDKLMNRGSGADDTDDVCLEKQIRDERQEENFKKLQATVEAQGKLLQAMAEKLRITL